MEELLNDLQNGKSSSLRNLTTVCVSTRKIQSKGIFFGDNPLHYSATLFWLQLFTSSATIILTVLSLKSIGQPVLFSQILGGIILGPSFMGRIHNFTHTMFPTESLLLLNTVAMFGIVFYLFLIGVQMDPWTLKETGKKELVIGIFAVIVPLLLTESFSMIISEISGVDKRITQSLAALGAAESAVCFPTIAGYLSELKILNCELGRVALSASMVSGVLSFSILSVTILVKEESGRIFLLLQTFFAALLVVMLLLLIARPTVVWMIRGNPEGQPLKEEYIYGVMLGVLVIALFGEAIGLSINFGPLVFGLVIPSGPPLGSTLVEKLNVIMTMMFMPIFFVSNGICMNIFEVKMVNFAVVISMVLIGCTGKFFGVFLTSIYFKMPFREAFSLGLVMTAQGVLEVDMFRKLKSLGIIADEAYVIICVAMLFTSGIATPLIRHFHDPSRRYAVYKRRTILHSKLNIELRLLVCIHDQENVPSMINFLQVSNPTKESPIGVYTIHLIELLGRASPLLVAHKPNKRPYSSSVTPSGRITNAFRHYEHSNKGVVQVHPFTTISPYSTMHNDISMIALDKGISLIIVPFHKQYGVNGALGWSKKGIRIVNKNILSSAPCSVGILINRGVLVRSRSILPNYTSYHVAVFFIGGADDREALALGARMVGHPSVHLTMIRMLEEDGMTTSSDHESDETVLDRELDNEVVDAFRFSLVDNNRFIYTEEVGMDGSATVSVIRAMENNYELILVGRRHDRWSPLLTGLTDWSEYNELGTIGDMFASQDFKGKTTILVIQQPEKIAEGLNESMET